MSELIRRLRLRFWLAVMDAIGLFRGGFGSRLYYWALGRANNAIDWGDGADCSGGSGEEPF